ncbi:MAG: DUF3459 domain-containing protein, partial [Leptolyngbyaceae bacterium]|nr:DUF3459 domain-containing protein [Leptolyngbyaceae bacterium]
PQIQGGFGIDAQWSDDFHHCIHSLLTTERAGYYEDFGEMEHLAAAWSRSFVYNWCYSPFRKRFHGSDVGDRPGSQFVVCAQNHDQIGNRMLGERLAQLISFDGLKLAAANVLLAPALPLLFMGEEYGEETPFLYFISHTDEDLVQAVREGRKREFAAFHLDRDPPDAASLDTFNRCILNWEQRNQGHHGTLRQFHQTLIELRRSLPPLMNFERDALEVQHNNGDRWLRVRRWTESEEVMIWMNWNTGAIALPSESIDSSQSSEPWHKRLDSADRRWKGSGQVLPHTLPGDPSSESSSKSSSGSSSEPSPELSAEQRSIEMAPLSVAVYHRAIHH